MSADNFGDRAPARVLAAVVLLGLFVRLVVLIARAPGPWLELHEYDDMARNLLAGRGYVYNHFDTLYRSYYPGVPYILMVTAVYAAFASGQLVIAAIQSAFSGTLALVVFAVARRFGGTAIAVLAAALTVLHPGLLYYDTFKMHPLSFDALTGSAGILALLRLSDRPSAGFAVMSGLVLGVATLQRGVLLVFFPLALLWLWRVLDRQEFRHRVIGAVVAGFVLVVGPWVARNYAVHGSPLMVTVTNETFWRGNAPGSAGHSFLPTGERVATAASESVRRIIEGAGELEQSRRFGQLALENIQRDPVGFVVGIGRKFLYFWTFSPSTGVMYPPQYAAVYLIYWFAALALAIVGTLFLVRSRQHLAALALLLLIFAAVSGVQSVYYVESRHRWAIEPLVLVLTSVGIARLASSAAIRTGRAGAQLPAALIDTK